MGKKGKKEAYIDLRKALDRVWKKGLRERLKSIGLGGKFQEDSSAVV